MLSLIGKWYEKTFSDPDALMLLILIIVVSAVLVLLGGYLMPVLVAIALAYLLEGAVQRVEQSVSSRLLATCAVMLGFIGFMLISLISLLPTISQQTVNFIEEVPSLWQQLQAWMLTLPDSYPELVQAEQIRSINSEINQKVVGASQALISMSFASLVGIGAMLVYMILVPLMMFFMLKDKQVLMDNIGTLLPNERRLIRQVSSEMNVQIGNYIRGKVIEILIVGAVSCVTFALMDLRYAMLLGVLVGLSVVIPYIGAAVVTIPVVLVAFIQWGFGAEFGYLMLAYFIIQALDGNLLVPILFSEAVSLHPLYIIIAVLFFGGLWGFWGVFFAIPLATLVKAVLNAWSTPVLRPAEDPSSKVVENA
ncbi:AI-2E family transporter [Alteromonas sp. LMIT006]|jgi:putative permease|uniref:AI-2E family transporter n=1 Tax=Alteromonadaceae TaxID=72275 RepID=UPI0020CA841F|nr:AI-2E family transporter [Alteromonas sp. LMIT006]UTP72143.1 AI-2E family transporter [Alteromonas sp. LMIT006]